ncbi:MAG: sarcosine oxidase subunit gamma [Hyphomicrobiaceae bacterium]
MADRIAARRSAFDGLALPSREGIAAVLDASPAARFVYRGCPELPAAAFGVELPTTPMRAQAQGDRAALWLGPDEWLLLAAEADGPAIAASLSGPLNGRAASLVDVGHRQIGLVVTGPHADALLNAGCPLDLDRTAFPVGMCTRTILAKVEIVLWRTGGEAFRVEVARSLVPYAVTFLAEAMHGVA